MSIIHSLVLTDALKETADAVFPYDAALPFDEELTPDPMVLADFLEDAGILCRETENFDKDVEVLAKRLYRASPDESETVIICWHEYGDESQAILGTFTRLREGYAAPYAFNRQSDAVMALA